MPAYDGISLDSRGWFGCNTLVGGRAPAWNSEEGQGARENLLNEEDQVLVMSKLPSGAPGAVSLTALWKLSTLILIAGTLSAPAAERTVLCEEFTNAY